MIVTPSVQATRRLRPTGPFHLPPASHPIRTEVDLLVEESSQQPDIVVRDIRREIEWRVQMSAAGSQTWQARIMLPSEPTIVRYHFEFPDGTTLHELRQHEGRNTPIYGEWTQQQFQITVYDPNAMPPAWTHGQVIYQIFPDRFANGDTSTDHVSKGVYGQEPKYLAWNELPEHPPRGRDFYGGDLRGMIERLDYLHDLGIDCIYLTPIFTSPSNHRYDTLDYLQIDPMLGTEDEFRELVDKAHSKNIKIVLDAVFNHCSSDSRYFNGAGHYGEDVGAAKNRQSPYYRWFAFKNWPDDYDGWIGLKHMPEFIECPEVEDFFIGSRGVAIHWLQRGIDGWRTDVTRWITDEFWRRFRKSVRAEKPDTYLIAEEWENASNYLVGDMFDATMNYRFAWALLGFFAYDKLTPTELDDRLETWRRDTPPPAQLAQMNLIDSHDTGRALAFCQGDTARFLQMVAFQLAYPGSPMIYYGDEAGLQGDYAEAGRRPYPWGNPDPKILAFYRKALAARRALPVLQTGIAETLIIDDAQRVYVFARRDHQQSVYAAFNGSDEPVTVQIPLYGSEDDMWQNVLTDDAAVQAANQILTVELPARGAAWYAPVV